MRKQVFEIRSPVIQQNAIQYIQQIYPNHEKPLIVTIQEKSRSLDQNRRLWATLRDISEQVNWHGRKLDSESWKCIFTAALKKQDVVPNLTNDGFVVLGQSTRKMRVSEFSDLLELINSFGAERGVKWSEESKQAMEWAARWGK
ncbi:recombination protein NinB [Klebsiella quasipneumoniae]|uniref:recombination protein NinB n=1 Tax=Klebsiella quasipneumoniae TaxID=1463165 RepID=UPI00161ECDDD|nr:recombination protein NinB [Klebsiella quasipneumoniae]QNC78751.1 recombination protein NinB [Klebsiella quasipneumoniae]